jgi:hypothetical protein
MDAVRAAFGAESLPIEELNLHYLSSGIDIDIVLPAHLPDQLGEDAAARLARIDIDALKRKLGAHELRVTHALRTTRDAPARP